MHCNVPALEALQQVAMRVDQFCTKLPLLQPCVTTVLLFLRYGEPYGLNDVVGCLLDCDAGQLSFSRNGRNLGVAFTLPPYLKGQVGRVDGCHG
jgi:hypothetical protein